MNNPSPNFIFMAYCHVLGLLLCSLLLRKSSNGSDNYSVGLASTADSTPFSNSWDYYRTQLALPTRVRWSGSRSFRQFNWTRSQNGSLYAGLQSTFVLLEGRINNLRKSPMILNPCVSRPNVKPVSVRNRSLEEPMKLHVGHETGPNIGRQHGHGYLLTRDPRNTCNNQ